MSRSVLHLIRRVAVVLIAVGTGSAMADPPSRVARLNHTEGRVMCWPAAASGWADAELNRPLLPGDKLATGKVTRAEIQIGSTVVRVDEDTHVEVLALGDDTAQLALTQGTVQMRVRSLPEGENFEVDTPTLAYRVAYPGETRIDVDSTGAGARVTVRSGAGAVYGERGQALPLGEGQQVMLRGRSLERVTAQESPPQDNFDRWAAERDRRDEQSPAAHHVPRELVGYQWLDANGQWDQDSAYGAVWFPSAPADWAPYRFGHWEWIAPWGWTWIDEAPWAFAPSHYGRWARIGARWAWVPGRLPLRPSYAPALVAFVGGTNATVVTLGGRTGVAWFPLAPGEPWRSVSPAASPYLDGVNFGARPLPATGHVYQRRADALTAMPAEDFARGRPLHGTGLSLSSAAISQSKVVPAPGMPAQLVEHASAPQAEAQRQADMDMEQTRMAEQLRLAQQRKPEQLPTADARPEQQKAGSKAQTRKPAAAPQQAKQSPRQGNPRQAKAKAPSASREQQARRTQAAKGATTAAKKPAMDSHAQQVEAARRAAGREAQLLRTQREEAARRRAQEQERARREASQRQQALSE